MASGFFGDAAAASSDGTATDSNDSDDDDGGLSDYDPPDPDPPSSGGYGDDDDDDNEGPAGFYGDAAAASPSGGSTDSNANDGSLGGTTSGSNDSGSGWVSEPPDPPDVDYDLTFEDKSPNDWLEDSIGNLPDGSGDGSSGDSASGESAGSDGLTGTPEGPEGFYGDAVAGTPIDADETAESGTQSDETNTDTTNDMTTDTDDLSGFFGDAAAATEDGTATDSTDSGDEWEMPENLQDVEITADTYGDFDRGGMAGVDSEDTVTYTTDQYGEVFFGENEEGEQTLMAPEGFELDGEEQDALMGRLEAMAGGEQPEQGQLPANFEERISALLGEQQAAYEERIAALMSALPDQAGGSEGGGGLSPMLGFAALLALGGGALYYTETNG